MSRSAGTLLIAIGAVLVVIGLAARGGLLSWLGRLPGDVRFERGGTRVSVPITSMIVASVALTVVLNLAMWLVRRLRG